MKLKQLHRPFPRMKVLSFPTKLIWTNLKLLNYVFIHLDSRKVWKLFVFSWQGRGPCPGSGACSIRLVMCWPAPCPSSTSCSSPSVWMTRCVTRQGILSSVCRKKYASSFGIDDRVLKELKLIAADKFERDGRTNEQTETNTYWAPVGARVGMDLSALILSIRIYPDKST